MLPVGLVIGRRRQVFLALRWSFSQKLANAASPDLALSHTAAIIHRAAALRQDSAIQKALEDLDSAVARCEDMIRAGRNGRSLAYDADRQRLVAFKYHRISSARFGQIKRGIGSPEGFGEGLVLLKLGVPDRNGDPLGAPKRL